MSGITASWCGRSWKAEGNRLRFSDETGEYPDLFWMDFPDAISEIEAAGDSLRVTAYDRYSVRGTSCLDFELVLEARA